MPERSQRHVRADSRAPMPQAWLVESHPALRRWRSSHLLQHVGVHTDEEDMEVVSSTPVDDDGYESEGNPEDME